MPPVLLCFLSIQTHDRRARSLCTEALCSPLAPLVLYHPAKNSNERLQLGKCLRVRCCCVLLHYRESMEREIRYNSQCQPLRMLKHVLSSPAVKEHQTGLCSIRSSYQESSALFELPCRLHRHEGESTEDGRGDSASVGR